VLKSTAVALPGILTLQGGLARSAAAVSVFACAVKNADNQPSMSSGAVNYSAPYEPSGLVYPDSGNPNWRWRQGWNVFQVTVKVSQPDEVFQTEAFRDPDTDSYYYYLPQSATAPGSNPVIVLAPNGDQFVQVDTASTGNDQALKPGEMRVDASLGPSLAHSYFAVDSSGEVEPIPLGTYPTPFDQQGTALAHSCFCSIFPDNEDCAI
jgi:hypothetical protein